MIAIESFQKFKFKDFYVLAGLAVGFTLIGLLLKFVSHPVYNSLIALFFFSLLLNFSVYVVRKAGSATIFSFLAALFSLGISNLDVGGMDKIWVFVLVGLVFEVVFLILKLEIKLLQLDILVGSGVAFGLMPLIMALVVSSGVLSGFLVELVNMVILYLLIGVLGSVVAFLAWHRLKISKFILQYEYMA